jgi:hypothetical protein
LLENVGQGHGEGAGGPPPTGSTCSPTPWCGGRRCSPTPWLGRRRVGMGRHNGGPEELLVCVEDVSERVQVVRSFTAVVTAEAIPHLSCKLW